MKEIIFIALFAFCMNVNAQFTLEQTYDSAGTSTNFCNNNPGQLMIINFETLGEQYVKINRCGRLINIYNLNHTLIKTISVANVPVNTNGCVGDFLYLSQHLFNLDNNIEFMYCSYINGGMNYYTGIYDEAGTLLFSDSALPAVKPNWMMQQYPIYNTAQGTKMILSYKFGQAKVFGLIGTLTTSIAESNNFLMAQNNISNPYPNPAINNTQIDYALPNGTNQGEIVFYNLQGKEIKRFKVDNTFTSLLISTSDLAAGTYYYQLQTTGQSSAGKKMVVIK